MKQPTNLEQLAHQIQGQLIGSNRSFSFYNTVSIDSRIIKKNQLFIAIVGQKVNGHGYIQQAFEKGAIACLISESIQTHSNQSLIYVKNTIQALQLLGKLYRHYFSGLIIGLTGSCGKTYTKDIIAVILKQSGSTLSTYKNYNNLIGVPLTLSQLTPAYQYAVIEMGTNQPGEINQLTQWVQPHIRLLLNAEAAHLERLHNIEGVAKEKGDIFNYLRSTDHTILNQDSLFFTQWKNKILKKKSAITTFSSHHQHADVHASHIQSNSTQTHFQLHTLKGIENITWSLKGHHHIGNACAATAVALAAGIPFHAIVTALKTIQLCSAGRGAMTFLKEGTLIIDDSYNANPLSTKAAIDMLSDISQPIKILILGDMTELGQFTQQAHQEIGYYARLKGIHFVLTCGQSSQWASISFGEGAQHFQSKIDLVTYLKQHYLTSQVALLIKGSRSSKMDQMIELLNKKNHTISDHFSSI
ncbi:MAG: UDP-N-acetylmuramoyl-tripeptide--D-alanyl-D-alanine ligase [Endozoicomonadaceae bacterium]|nr:UDP-N-acetylmuramoyl-tripeptide--D-alanyl-D-alanine ligase [Endozoicomonadaceae bacterium]